MDYGVPERRKNKNDKRSKARFNRFKQGGALRAAKFPHPQQGSQQQADAGK